jgi:hypothetical protein
MSSQKDIIRQYRLARQSARNNFRESKLNVPFVDDNILYGVPDFRGVYSKGMIGHTGPNG